MPGTLKSEKISTAAGSDMRQLQIQYNNLVKDAQIMALAGSTDNVWSWQSAAANSIQAMGRGSTDTAVATGKLTFAINGIPETKAAVTTGTALTAQTVPADTWAIYAIDSVAGGTLSVAPGAANATTGYATEAAAIAALPARITLKARLGYLTVKTMAATAWIGATDALAGGTTGNEASQTNYYPYDGLFAPTGVAYGPSTLVTARVNSTGSAWTGGRNGVVIAPVLAIGSTDTRVSSTAFVYNCNGVANLNKAANTVGTAFGALGTVPADKWGIIAMFIDAVGTQTFVAGPALATGYNSEDAAKADLSKIFPSYTSTVQVCLMGYVTIKTGSGLAWITGTDALAGGTTGNEASATNYYPTPGVTLLQGQSASLLANRSSVPLTSSNY